MVDRLRIGIIGAGQIGSRHLQAFARWQHPAELYVIDPDEQALDNARKRLDEAGGPRQSLTVWYGRRPEAMHLTKLDLAIVATGADHRLDVLTQLLRYCPVANLIVEKVLFQDMESYARASELFHRHNVRVWVNCPLRTYPYFSRLKSVIRSENIQYTAYGSSLNLGSNAVHHLDLFSYLTGEEIGRIRAEFLHDRLHVSTRKGYMEFTGTIHSETSGGSRFELTSFPYGDEPLTIRIMSENRVCIIYPAQRRVVEHSASGSRDAQFDFPLQSEQTHLIAEQILKTGSCSLPDYEHASRIHRNLLRSLLDRLESITGRRHERCPIT